MKLRNPDWFLLIHDWVERAGMTGRTLPFLTVACMKYHRGHTDVTIHDAETILSEILTTAIPDYIVQIRWCDNVDAPVIGMRKVSNQPPRQWIPHRNNKSCTLVEFHTSLADVFSNNIEKIIDGLLKNAAQPIKDNVPSRLLRAGKMMWTDFSPEEISGVLKVLSAR